MNDWSPGRSRTVGGGGGGGQDSGRRGPGTPEPLKMQILNSERLKEGKD